MTLALYVLDTDHLSLLQRGHPHVIARLAGIPIAQRAVTIITSVRILSYDAAAAALFETLRGQGIRIGTQDLRIASICLSQQAILATRNQRDFRQVPNLLIEDWSLPDPV